ESHHFGEERRAFRRPDLHQVTHFAPGPFRFDGEADETDHPPDPWHLVDPFQQVQALLQALYAQSGSPSLLTGAKSRPSIRRRQRLWRRASTIPQSSSTTASMGPSAGSATS